MKNVIMGIIIGVLLLTAGFFAYKYYTQRPVASADTGIAQQAREVTNLEVTRINKNIGDKGLVGALLEDKANLITNISQVRDSAKQEIDSIARLLGIERGRVGHYLSMYTTTMDSLLEARRTPTGYDYKDDWAYMSFTNPTKTDSAKFSFRYNAEVNMVEYWDRANFLSPKKHYIDLWLSDPRATINSVKRLKIEPTPKQFGVSVQAIGDYHPKHGAGLGAGARVQIGRIGLQGAYLYDGQRWYPAFRGSYDLISW